MRAYGQKKAYGRLITRTYYRGKGGKIVVTTGVKNRKRLRVEKIDLGD